MKVEEVDFVVSGLNVMYFREDFVGRVGTSGSEL